LVTGESKLRLGNDPRLDVYSFGVVLLELLLNRKVQDEAIPDLGEKHSRSGAERPS